MNEVEMSLLLLRDLPRVKRLPKNSLLPMLLPMLPMLLPMLPMLLLFDSSLGTHSRLDHLSQRM